MNILSKWPYRSFKQIEGEKSHCDVCVLSKSDLKILKKAVVLFVDSTFNSDCLLTLIQNIELSGKRAGVVLSGDIEVEKASKLASFVIGRAHSSFQEWREGHEVKRSVVLDSSVDQGALFWEYVQSLKPIDRSDACFNLHRAYEKGEMKAGYYLLWLIKSIAGCSYEIPILDHFTKTSVSEILNETVQSGNVSKPTLFLELLLNSRVAVDTLSLSMELMSTYSREQWPKKDELLLLLLSRSPDQSKKTIAEALKKSSDPETQEIGIHLLNAFMADNYTVALPSLYKLQSLIPELKNRHASILGIPLPPFREKRKKELNAFTIGLEFDEKPMLFVDDELFVTVDKRYLLTFDCKSEMIIRGFPLQEGYDLVHMGNQIAYLTEDEKMVKFFSLKTGEMEYRLDLPVAHESLHNRIYKTEEDILYYMDDKSNRLFRGSIGGEWERFSLESDYQHQFVPLSTHCGLMNRKGCILFGPTGKSVVFPTCQEAYAKGDKLFLIQRDGDNPLLSVRTLRSNSVVVSEVEMEFRIPFQLLQFGKLCDNGELVLLSGYYVKEILFINLKTLEVLVSQEKIPEKTSYFIDEKTGEVWFNAECQRKLKKISSQGVQEMGKSISSGKLLHVNKQGKLYVYFSNKE